MKHQILLRRLTFTFTFTFFTFILHAQTILRDSTFTNPTIEARLSAAVKAFSFTSPPEITDSLHQLNVPRGVRQLPAHTGPLCITDGVAYPLALVSAIPEKKVVSIDMLKSQQAAMLFGVEGVNGAVVIMTSFRKGQRRRFLRRWK